MRLRILLAFGLIGLFATQAAAAPAGVPSGPGPRVRATMYATVLKGAKVQILVRECAVPKEQRRCMLIPDGLRSAIEHEVSGAVRWGYRAWPKGGKFYVLAPVYRVGARAWFRYAWTDPAPNGCTGGGRNSFHRGGGGWTMSHSSGYGGCP